MGWTITGKDLIKVAPEDIEHDENTLAGRVSQVGNFLREAAYGGNAFSFLTSNSFVAPLLSLGAGVADAGAHMLENGLDLKGVGEIAAGTAAEAGALAATNALNTVTGLPLTQITAGARWLGVDVLDAPALARQGGSALFNKLAGNETSAIYQPRGADAKAQQQQGSDHSAPKTQPNAAPTH